MILRGGLSLWDANHGYLDMVGASLACRWLPGVVESFPKESGRCRPGWGNRVRQGNGKDENRQATEKSRCCQKNEAGENQAHQVAGV